jgi:hypothetical protein
MSFRTRIRHIMKKGVKKSCWIIPLKKHKETLNGIHIVQFAAWRKGNEYKCIKKKGPAAELPLTC